MTDKLLKLGQADYRLDLNNFEDLRKEVEEENKQRNWWKIKGSKPNMNVKLCLNIGKFEKKDK